MIALHPKVADDYRRQVAALNEAATATPEARAEAVPRIRDLIERIVLSPAKTARGVEIEVAGRLASLIALATGQPMRPQSERMIAGERVKGIEPSS